MVELVSQPATGLGVERVDRLARQLKRWELGFLFHGILTFQEFL